MRGLFFGVLGFAGLLACGNTFAQINLKNGADIDMTGSVGSQIVFPDGSVQTTAAGSNGTNNTASGTNAFIGGGQNNSATTNNAGITAGQGNTVSGVDSFIGGGKGNTASSAWSAIGGGTYNAVTDGNYAFVGGGWSNSAKNLATVGGGGYNQAHGTYSAVGGGQSNEATGERAVIAGGKDNLSVGNYSAITGGYGNVAGNVLTPALAGATVGGGGNNEATSFAATVAGGHANDAIAYGATVGGGGNNKANGYASTVAGGNFNQADGYAAAMGGGDSNFAAGDRATVPGGSENSAAGDYSFAAGRKAKIDAAHDGAFVFADGGPNANFASAAANEFAVRASGGVRMLTNAAGTTGQVMAAGGSSWAAPSMKSLKENYEQVDSVAILETLASIPIEKWNYIDNEDSIKHIGPYAEDFHTAFGLNGGFDGRITTQDLDGVALSAIQGVNTKLERALAAKDADIQALRAELEAMKQAMAELASK